MNEQEIINLIKNDKWMMDVLHIAETLDLPDWAIGAGFVRNKVWDHLHGYKRYGVDTTDIDLVYFNPEGNNKKADQKLSEELTKSTGITWEIVNEVYAHVWNNLPPYKSTEDAISKWPETATCVGIKIENGDLKLVAPHGIGDLVNLIVRASPDFPNGFKKVEERAGNKQWLEKWPKLKLLD